MSKTSGTPNVKTLTPPPLDTPLEFGVSSQSPDQGTNWPHCGLVVLCVHYTQFTFILLLEGLGSPIHCFGPDGFPSLPLDIR